MNLYPLFLYAANQAPEAAKASDPLSATAGSWAEMLQKYGGWGVSVALVMAFIPTVRFAVKKLEERDDKVASLQEAAVKREKDCAEERQKTVEAVTDVWQKRYEALREESRTQHEKRNAEIKDLLTTMTTTIANDVGAKQQMSKSFDGLSDQVDKLKDEVHDLSKG